jgi:hypothetical protein
MEYCFRKYNVLFLRWTIYTNWMDDGVHAVFLSNLVMFECLLSGQPKYKASFFRRTKRVFMRYGWVVVPNAYLAALVQNN